MHSKELPVGVFDSGVGGLTVLKALREALPHERFIYLGDTARLPYGTKTPKTVSAYAIAAVNFLLEQGIKFLVVACNTATALALPALKEHFPNLPMMGVVEPAAHKALMVSQNKHISVIATQATVNSRCYVEAITRNNHDAQVLARPAPLLVALAEEGMLEGDIAELTVRHYLEPILNDQNFKADTLILGCTHFPALRKTIEVVVNKRMHIVDSAHSVATEVKAHLDEFNLAQSANEVVLQPARFLVTDGIGRFMQVAEIFLEAKISADDISLVDIV